jgi:hypothetical protein
VSDITDKTTVEELAGIVAEQLRSVGIEVVLSGGALVSLYSVNEYESKDIDFITSAEIKDLEKALSSLGFKRGPGRHFEHPATTLFIEFPSGPLAVGNEFVTRTEQLKTRYGVVSVLSPTDSVKDRLAGFLHWSDRQNLAQAKMIASRHLIDLEDVFRWAQSEKNDPTMLDTIMNQLVEAQQQFQSTRSEPDEDLFRGP